MKVWYRVFVWVMHIETKFFIISNHTLTCTITSSKILRLLNLLTVSRVDYFINQICICKVPINFILIIQSSSHCNVLKLCYSLFILASLRPAPKWQRWLFRTFKPFTHIRLNMYLPPTTLLSVCSGYRGTNGSALSI